MLFIVEKEITIVGMFSQNGFQTIKLGTPVDIVFDSAPGLIYHAKITAIPKGVGQGQIAASGTLARTTALGGTSVFQLKYRCQRKWAVTRCASACRETPPLSPRRQAL
jgi:hypothetical protein